MTMIGTLALLAGWAAVAVLALILSGFFALIALRLFAVREPDVSAYPSLIPGSEPHVLVQLPIFNEAGVVEGALRSATALEWPRDRLHIQLLDDSTDDTPIEAARCVTALREQGFDVVHVRRADRSGFKAGALEAGLHLSDAPFAAVLDADFRAPPQWLRGVMTAMMATPRAAFVQSRNEFVSAAPNWLTRAQQVLQDAHYVMEQPGRAWRGLPFQFNGTGGVWRREAVADAGGWSHDTLAEDLDLAMRCFLKGWGGVFLLAPAPVGEVPADGRAFAVQQQRWSKGIVQVGRKHGRAILSSTWSLEAKAMTLLLFAVHLMFPAIVVALGALALSSLVGMFSATLLTALVLELCGSLLVTFGMTAPAFFMLKRGSWLDYLKRLASLPFMGLALSFSNAASVVTGARAGASGEFVRTPKSGSTDRPKEPTP